MRRTIVLAVLAAVVGLVLAAGASAGGNSGGNSVNNGGGTPKCGASCDQSHNPGDYEKPCNPVPGNGCHQLPDTPCERGHGGTEIGNKHCGPGLTILKEQSPLPGDAFTHNTIDAPLFLDFFYRVTVTNLSDTQYTLVGSDPLCDTGQFAFEDPGEFSTPRTLAAQGTVVYYCQIDPIGGAGIAGDSIPDGAVPGGGPYPLTNAVSVVATPVGGGDPVTLTDSVTANFN
jgi:hypothetical protein